MQKSQELAQLRFCIKKVLSLQVMGFFKMTWWDSSEIIPAFQQKV
jgi:hypothetical protein